MRLLPWLLRCRIEQQKHYCLCLGMAGLCCQVQGQAVKIVYCHGCRRCCLKQQAHHCLVASLCCPVQGQLARWPRCHDCCWCRLQQALDRSSGTMSLQALQAAGRQNLGMAAAAAATGR